jgi:hypothetical protein
MSKFKFDNRALTLLSAQVNLSETFTHTLRSTPQRKALSFRLKIERNDEDTTFIVEMGTERHTLTLANGRKSHLKLADFIEEIANGPGDHHCNGAITATPHAERQYGVLSTEQREQVFNLVCKGGTLILDLGFELPIHVAHHRTYTRTGSTTIMSIGIKNPRTKCFTLTGNETDIYKRLIESINHLAAIATPAAHAA